MASRHGTDAEQTQIVLNGSQVGDSRTLRAPYSEVARTSKPAVSSSFQWIAEILALLNRRLCFLSGHAVNFVRSSKQ